MTWFSFAGLGKLRCYGNKSALPTLQGVAGAWVCGKQLKMLEEAGCTRTLVTYTCCSLDKLCGHSEATEE